MCVGVGKTRLEEKSDCVTTARQGEKEFSKAKDIRGQALSGNGAMRRRNGRNQGLVERVKLGRTLRSGSSRPHLW